MNMTLSKRSITHLWDHLINLTCMNHWWNILIWYVISYLTNGHVDFIHWFSFVTSGNKYQVRYINLSSHYFFRDIQHQLEFCPFFRYTYEWKCSLLPKLILIPSLVFSPKTSHKLHSCSARLPESLWTCLMRSENITLHLVIIRSLCSVCRYIL